MRRRVLLILGVAGALVALVLVAAAIAVATMDVNALAEPLADRVRAATGRPFTIGGPVKLALSLEPTLRMDNVVLGNAPGGRAAEMARAARVEAQVALLPLLHRRFEIVRVTLVDPVINLEVDRQGRGNWMFGEPQASADPAAAASVLGAGPAVGIGEVEVINGRVSYVDLTTNNVMPVVIDSLTLHSHDPNGPISGEFRGSVNGVPVALKGNLGSQAILRAQQWPLPVDVAGTVAGRTAKLQAKITPGASTRVEDLALVFGDLVVEGSVAVDHSGARPRYVIALHLPRLVPEALLLPAGATGTLQTPQPGHAASDHLLPDRVLPLAGLRSADAQGTLAIDAIGLPHGQALTQARLRFVLQGGRLEISELSAAGLGGTIAVRGSVRALDDAARGATIDVHAEGRDLQLAAVLALAGAPREVSGGRTSLTLDGKASGASLHQWAASFDGVALLLVGPAELKSPPGNSTAVLDQLGALVNPFRTVKGMTDLRCAVVRLPLNDGVAHVDRSIAFETAEIGVSATGTIDLRNETVDLALKPQVRSGIPIDVAGFADLVRVKGPIEHPQIAIDPAKSAETVARIGAAIGTGGWSLLGEALFNTAAAADSPCAIALNRKGTPAAAPSQSRPAPDIPNDIGKALGRLFGR